MTPEQIQGLLRGELSRHARGSHVALLVASLAMATCVASLWLTERQLPLRTQVAFFLVVTVAAAWALHAFRVLTRRSVLLVPHQVQAARLAVWCCAVFVAGCVAALLVAGGSAAVLALVTSLVMLTVALVNLQRARVRHLALLRRRSELS